MLLSCPVIVNNTGVCVCVCVCVFVLWTLCTDSIVPVHLQRTVPCYSVPRTTIPNHPSFLLFFLATDVAGRAEGTPVNDETFAEWNNKFNAEMEEERERLKAQASADSKKKGSAKNSTKEVDKSGRLTGFQQFTDKAGTLNLEAMEAAAENAQADENEEEVDVVDEDLFDVSDDDLDDLDFDSDDEDDDEPDI